MNPQHTVPTLDDNGKYLWDSHAIIPYLVGQYAKTEEHQSLYPKDLYTRARIDQRLHFDSGVLFNSLATMFRTVFFEGAVEFTEKHLKSVHEAFQTLETFLAVDPYLAGDHLTIADLSIIASVTQATIKVKLDADKYPKILAWIERLEQLPYFHDTNTVNVANFAIFFEGMLARNVAALKK